MIYVLIKDPTIGKVTTEMATYKQREGIHEVEAKDFEVTQMELGILSCHTNDHMFKYLVDRMLNQLKKDTQEKRDLKQSIISMAEYIDSLRSFGALPVVKAPQSFDLNSSDNH